MLLGCTLVAKHSPKCIVKEPAQLNYSMRGSIYGVMSRDYYDTALLVMILLTSHCIEASSAYLSETYTSLHLRFSGKPADISAVKCVCRHTFSGASGGDLVSMRSTELGLNFLEMNKSAKFSMISCFMSQFSSYH